MLKTLFKETSGVRLVSVLTPLCMVGEVVMEMIVPRLMSSIIDDGVTAGNMQHIYTVGRLDDCGRHCRVDFWRGRRCLWFGSRNRSGAQPAQIHVPQHPDLQLSPALIKYSTAGLVTRMTTDVTNIQNAYQMSLRMSIRAPASLIVAMVMSFTITISLPASIW